MNVKLFLILGMMAAAGGMQAALINIGTYLTDANFDQLSLTSSNSYRVVGSTAGTAVNGWYESSTSTNVNSCAYQLGGATTKAGTTAGTANSGLNYMLIYIASNGSQNTWIRTTDSFNLTPGDTYYLQLAVRKEATITALDSFAVALTAVGDSLASFTNTTYLFSTNWQTITYSYTYTGTSTVSTNLRIYGYRPASSAALAFDTLVPEPATWGLMALGALAGSGWRRRR
ncbi:MAG: PEP-CTERM sorting domain-containing protein [Lentisphaeria bacterium]